MVELILKIIMLIEDILGIVLLTVSISELRKLNQEHHKVSDSDYFLDHEKVKQRKIVVNLIVGIAILIATSMIGLVLLFIR